MGTLQYLTSEHVAEIDDRTLAHLQVVICSKLRRNEHFTLRLASEGDSGPVTVLWMTCAVPITFTYNTPTAHVINPAWLHILADTAASNGGLWLVPEPSTPQQPTVGAARRDLVPA